MAKTGGWESDEEVDSALIAPDRKRIAFLWLTSDGKEQLRVMPNERGAKPTVLIDNPEIAAWPAAWSPDGKSILVTLEKNDRTWQLAWVSAANGAVTPLKSLGWRLRTRPSLSPDGKHIAYSALATNPSKALSPYVSPSPPDSADQHIYVLTADGSRETVLVKGNSVNESPIWTPDGRRVLFVSNRSGQFTLWSVSVTDGQPEPGSLSPARADTGRISPIGMTQSGSYYYVKDSIRRSETGERLYPFDLFTANLDSDGKVRGRATRLLDTFVDANQKPALSPDGKSLAFLRRRPGNDSNVYNQVVVRSLEGVEELVYTRNASIGSAIWFHNGENLLIRMGSNRLFRLELKTGEFTSVEAIAHVSLPPRIGAVAISPNDTTLYMTSRDPKDGTGSIVSLDLKTGELKQVWISMTPRRLIEDLALSPDGQTLAMISDSQLAQISVKGTDYRELYASVYRGMLAWGPDGRQIFFLGADQAGRAQLMRWTGKVGKAESTGVMITQVGHPLALSPEGSTLIFSDITASSELWRIDNLSAVGGTVR